jgi:hypothetical protein
MKKINHLNLNKKTLTIIAIAVVILISIIYITNKRSNDLENRNIAEQETQIKNSLSIVEKVGQLTQLPKDESPLIYDVVDPVKLEGKDPFFAGASAGDKVLVYKNAKTAILYNPTQNIIIRSAIVTELEAN